MRTSCPICAAEIAFFGDPSSGASDDLKQAIAFVFSGQYSWGLGCKNLFSISMERLLLLDPNTQMGRDLNAMVHGLEVVMKIGEISKRSGLSRDTTRLYEKTGVISSSASQSDTNTFRESSDDVLLQLRFVSSARDAGISIADLRDLMKAFFDTCDPSEAENVLIAEIAQRTERVSQIENVISFLDVALRQESRNAATEIFGPSVEQTKTTEKPMPDRNRLLPSIAFVVLSVISLLAFATSQTRAMADHSPLDDRSMTVGAIAQSDAGDTDNATP